MYNSNRLTQTSAIISENIHCSKSLFKHLPIVLKNGNKSMGKMNIQHGAQEPVLLHLFSTILAEFLFVDIFSSHTNILSGSTLKVKSRTNAFLPAINRIEKP